jgi:uncharacterized protein (TIGR04255 family)
VRYKKAPILEAALEFRWQPERPLDAIRASAGLSVFSGFEAPKERKLVNATLDLQGGQISQESKEVGFELTLKDGSQIVIIESDKFVFVQRAPYDQWQNFSQRALSFLEPVALGLGVSEFNRIGVRFVNRIDIPQVSGANVNTDDYITVKFDGPRQDRGVVREFQMRVVKPTLKDGISYALGVATSASLLPDHTSIILDIDVFTEGPTPASGEVFAKVLSEMRDEKNEIFHSCLKKPAVDLFGGVEE